MVARGKDEGNRLVREFGMDMYTLLYLKQITNKDLLYSTKNSAQCYVAAWRGVGFGGEWTHVYVWLSPSAVNLELLQKCKMGLTSGYHPGLFPSGNSRQELFPCLFQLLEVIHISWLNAPSSTLKLSNLTSSNLSLTLILLLSFSIQESCDYIGPFREYGYNLFI